MHWAYGGGQRQRQLLMIIDIYYSGPGYGPEDSHVQINMVCSIVRKEGRKLYNK